MKIFNKRHKLFVICIIGAFVLMLSSCAVETPAEQTTAPPATATPDVSQVTAAPTETPAQIEAPAATAAAASVSAEEYLPRENIKVTMHRNLGDSASSKITYVYAACEHLDDESYVVTQFYESQPFLYTDFYADEDGVWSRFSDSASENISFVMPQTLEVGMEFISLGDEAIVLEIGADFEYGGYSASDCLIISTASAAYSQNVFHVYQKDVGEIARYMKYDADIIDMVLIAETVEEISADYASEFANGRDE